MSTLTRPDRLESSSFPAGPATNAELPSASAFLARLGHAWRAWREQREAMDALYRLEDRELRDIGIERSEIPAAVRGSLGLRRR